ncbi:riboflavin synthase [Limnothrix sp. FACHB-1083]|uniref:riboflavin synthase n=1 Tax=unclassified Limnothrix TaxID=2632864 RepID=UPI0016807078|nr:riboflavin synthase [Limnothrix sp. FACHB-1083]MBD2192939.1 riboflavin synthase [Limnothrix sp. FACHB-1088]
MFTGLVQGLGTLERLGNDRVVITCEPEAIGAIVPGLELGDSVAVNGVCLTVETLLPDGFVAAVSPETIDRTTLGQVQRVNLEPSLRVGSKIGGHFVTGHVDGPGWFESAIATATSWELSFQASDRVARYIVQKGSIAIDGISLTIADCSDDGRWFKVAAIPHTYAHTTLQELQPGAAVNLEGDVLGKYVEKLLRSGAGPLNGGAGESYAITPDFLAEHGYL